MAGLLAGTLILTHVVIAALGTLFEPLQSQTIDRLFRLRSNFESFVPSYDDAVVHVAIDEESLRRTEGFYFGRHEHARLVRNLGRMNVAAQLHDVIFGAPQDEAEDRELVAATREAGDVFYGMALGLSRGEGLVAPEAAPDQRAILERAGWAPNLVGDPNDLPVASAYVLTFPALAAAAEGLGALDLVPDVDGVHRRVSLIVRDEGRYVPAAALRVLCHYLGVSPDRVEVDPGRAVTLRDALDPRWGESRDVVIPVDRAGRMIVNYVGPWGSMTTYPLLEIFNASDERFVMEMLKDELAGKIAMVSFVSTGMGSVGAVPTDPTFPLSGVHANVINTVLTGQFLRDTSPPAMFLLVEFPLLLLVFVAARYLSTIPFVATALALIVVYLSTVALAFLYQGRILDVPGPVMALALSALVLAAYQFHVESRARAVLRGTFDAYFPPPVVDKIMGRSERLLGTAQKKELTILFSDVEDFTKHTAAVDAADVRRLLNEYFETMIDIVFRHGGTLDKFIGDGLMVFFGDPESQPDHAERCVRAAVDMQRAVRELNGVWAERGDMPLKIRIGINTGEVVVGNMGSSRRLSYTVLGEAVNLAQRLEAAAPAGGVLISRRTRELLGDAHQVEPRDPIVARGFDRPIPVYQVSLGPSE
jgi:adenylate cyclase